MAPELATAAHVRYFKHCLNLLPAEATSQDATRMTLAHLCLVGLAALGRLEDSLSEKERAGMIEWIYAQQIPAGRGAAYGGFRGGSLFGPHEACEYAPADSGNVAATYSALCALLLLGDDLARVDRAAAVAALRQLQQPSGTFAPHPGTTELDPRFIYCACAVSAILGDWSGVDRDAATRYILGCCSYDGGMTQAPFHESHGGHLYCCVASLSLMGRLDALPDRRRTLQWALFRHAAGSGYQGRANKTADVCYSFWVGAAIEILGGHALADTAGVADFGLQCEAAIGGMAKWPSYRPDPLHAALGIVGYSFCRPDALPRMSPELLLPDRVVRRMRALADDVTRR
ncbi:geranylgeranyl transferase type-1 subunit beta [Coemansia javaensis]|uniref:Geranylgeranyl transferase type-1 subunit beta n=1 Tax=Coemansia javaensis TaxID=2761396 RepID=A0A9W8HA06_9FUNG|nr:geranylgeranyl transferase type-1 subunit beta [Coemansia javaensis]